MNQAQKLADIVNQLPTEKNIQTRFIAVTSGKGGVGKTTFSANIGYLLSRRGYRVGLFDADIGLANLDVMLGIKSEKTILDLMNGECSVEDIIVHIDEFLCLIPGENGGEILKFGERAMLDRFYTEMKKLNFLDYLVIDTGAGIGENVQAFLMAADHTIVVTTPDPAAITDAYAMVKTLHAAKKPLALVINQTQNDREGELVFEKIKRVASLNMTDLRLDLLGLLPRDADLARSVRNRYLLAKEVPNAEIVSRLNMVLDNLLQLMEHGVLDTPQTSGLERFFKRLLTKF
ncbi:site-determining protein [Campylobacterota bacterium]|nr:site-determining protein [Campylobacterota bacterium]